MNPSPSLPTIARLLHQADLYARRGEWDAAAHHYYRVLVLAPGHPQATQALQRLYQHPALAHDIRRALSQVRCAPTAARAVGRRQMAFAYRVLSRWPGWLCMEEGAPVPVLEEAAEMLEHAYLSGEDSDLQTVWEYYERACVTHPAQRQAVQWWMARQYAQHGLFADAAEILQEVLGQAPTDAQARYMLAELRWWRDNAHTLAWLIPSS